MKRFPRLVVPVCVCLFLAVVFLSGVTIPFGGAAARRSGTAADKTAAAPNAVTELFISEYVEGSLNNKAIELYNGTANPIDLGAGNYTLQVYLNNFEYPSSPYNLSGVIASGGTFVIVKSDAAAALLALADDSTLGPVMTFDGNDTVVLRKGGENGQIIDSIGQKGVNPGTKWGTSPTSTRDNTLVRKPSVCAGDRNFTDSFDPAVEWNGFPMDTFGNLRSHTAACGPPRVELSVSSSAGSEGAATVITVTATASRAVSGNQTVSLSVAGTNITAGDYNLSSSNILIADGAVSGSANFTIVNDSVYELSETATVGIASVSSGLVVGANATQTITITDDDLPPQLAIADVSAAEGSDGMTNFQLTVTKAGATELASSVNFATAGDTASAGDDFQMTSGTLQLAPNETSKSINVAVTGDTVVEPDERFFVDLTSAAGATISDSRAEAIIVNDDAAVEFAVSSIVEDESQNAEIVVRRVGAARPFTVNYSTAAGSANAGGDCSADDVDFVAQNGVFSFGADENFKTLSIPLCADFRREGSEAFSVNLSAAAGAVLGLNAAAEVSINDTAAVYKTAAPITLTAESQQADPFPSSLNVTGARSPIAGVRVTLFDVSVVDLSRLRVLLVSPQNRAFLLLSAAGGAGGPSSSSTLTFADVAPSLIPDGAMPSTGAYRPTNYSAVTIPFPAPAPLGPYGNPGPAGVATAADTFNSYFGNSDPNGVWTLYVVDDSAGLKSGAGAGTIAGWGIDFISPTAASAALGGRVTRPDGSGIYGANLKLEGEGLAEPKLARTNAFGYYEFNDLAVGQIYIITVNAKRYQFAEPVRAVNLLDSISNENFIGELIE